MSGNTLRSLIVSVSAETGAYQREMARAARTGQNYLRTIGDGNRQAAAGWRSQQAAINAQSVAMASLTSSVSSYAGAMLGALAVSNLLSQADKWGQTNARLKLASTSTDDFARSQQVLFEISQKTGTAFNDNAMLFSRSAGSLRDFGYSSQSVLQVTEALALGLQISGASATEASSVITQFSQALAQGVLRGNDFVSVNANGDRVMRALAAGMGVARKDLKAMANEGLLTVEKIVPALVNQLGTLQQEYAAMPNTISGSMKGLSNAFQRWVGDADSATGTTQQLSKAIGWAAQNIDVLASVAAVTGIALLAKKSAEASLALIAQVAAIRAAQAAEIGRTRAQVDATAVLVRKTAAEVLDARSQVIATLGTQQHAAALSRLRLARLADMQAIEAHTAAQVASARASSLLGNASRGLLGLVGGPLGLGFMVATTAASFLLFSDGADKAAQASIDLKKPIEELRTEWEALGAAQQRPILGKLAEEQAEAKKLAAEILADMRAIALGPSGNYLGGRNFSANQYQRAAAAGNFGRSIKGGIDIDTAAQNLIANIGPTDELKSKLEGLAAQYQATIARIHAAGEQTSLLTRIMGAAQSAAEGLGTGLSTIQPPEPSLIKAWEKRIEGLNERVSKIKDPSELGEINRQAERDGLGRSPEGERLLQAAQAAAKLADASLLAQKAQEELSRKAKEAAAAAEREARQLHDNYARTLSSLNEQVEVHGRKTELAKIEFEINNGQLKQLDQAKKIELERAAIAVDHLNTQKSYKDLMTDLQKQEDSLLMATRKRYDELARLQAQGGLSSDQYKAGAQAISKASIAEAPKYGGLDPSIGGPIGEMIKSAEAEAELKAWHEKQLAMQAELHAQQLSSEQEYLDRVAEIHQINQQRLADIQGSYKVAMLSTFSELAGNAADMVGKIAGEQSGAYKVLFLAQKAFAVASIIMNAQIAAAKAPAELTVLGGIPVGAALLAAGYANAGMVAGMTLAGMAHDGIDSIPKEGTWLLQKGERVVDGRTNSDLKQFLNSTPDAINQTSAAPQINIHINGDGSGGMADSTQGYEAMGEALLATVRAEMPKIARGVIINEKGQNGLLDPNNRRAG